MYDFLMLIIKFLQKLWLFEFSHFSTTFSVDTYFVHIEV